MKSVALLKPHATSIAYLKPTHVGPRIMHTNVGQNRHVDYCFSRLLTLPCYIVAVHYTADGKLNTKYFIKIWSEEHLEDLGVDESIILKWFVKKFEDGWRELVDTILNTVFAFNKMRVICWNRKLMKNRTGPNLTFFIHSFHWHVQNAVIPCRSQELLPFFPIVYFFLPLFSANYASILPHFVLPSISWSTSWSCCFQIHT